MSTTFTILSTKERTKIAKHSQNISAGTEKYQKVVQKREILIHYTYTSSSGLGFTTLKHSLEECRLHRNKWYITCH